MANDDSTYFDDVGQFWELQRQAVSALAEQYRESAAWVELTEHYTIPHWQYREVRERRGPAGVLINLSPTGRVEVRDGLVRHDVSTPTSDLTADSPLAPRPKPAYSAVLCELIAHEKSLAVQAALLAEPRKAREVAVVLMLAVNDCYDRPLELTPHRCLYTGAESPEPSNGYATLEQHAHPLAAQVLPEAAGEDKPVWKQLLKERRDATSLYGARSRN